MNRPPLIFPVKEAIAQNRLDAKMMTFDARVIKLTLAVLLFLAIKRRTNSTTDSTEIAKRGL